MDDADPAVDLGLAPRVVPEHAHRARARIGEARAQRERGRLAGAVVAEQAGHAGRELERDLASATVSPYHLETPAKTSVRRRPSGSATTGRRTEIAITTPHAAHHHQPASACSGSVAARVERARRRDRQATEHDQLEVAVEFGAEDERAADERRDQHQRRVAAERERPAARERRDREPDQADVGRQQQARRRRSRQSRASGRRGSSCAESAKNVLPTNSSSTGQRASGRAAARARRAACRRRR